MTTKITISCENIYVEKSYKDITLKTCYELIEGKVSGNDLFNATKENERIYKEYIEKVNEEKMDEMKEEREILKGLDKEFVKLCLQEMTEKWREIQKEIDENPDWFIKHKENLDKQESDNKIEPGINKSTLIVTEGSKILKEEIRNRKETDNGDDYEPKYKKIDSPISGNIIQINEEEEN
jgi:hypothetical protein